MLGISKGYFEVSLEAGVAHAVAAFESGTPVCRDLIQAYNTVTTRIQVRFANFAVSLGSLQFGWPLWGRLAG